VDGIGFFVQRWRNAFCRLLGGFGGRLRGGGG
jgi:hypothetical protein